MDRNEPLYLPTLLAALSVGTDLANDQPSGTAMRVAHIALAISENLGLSEGDRVDVFYASLARFLGCTAYSHETSEAFLGDDIAFHSTFAAVDLSRPAQVLLAAMSGLAPDAGPLGKGRALIRTLRCGRSLFEGYARAHCEVASLLARRLHMSEAVQVALQQTYARWNGTGQPALAGEDISLVARIVQVARTIETLLRESDGSDHLVSRLRGRAGRTLDPNIVAACERVMDRVLAIARESSPSEALLGALPTVAHPATTVGEIAQAFADFADLKSVFRAGHSHAVAALAVAAATGQGLDEADVEQLRYAALLHDLGMVTIPTGILESPRPLSLMEQEKVRLHPYYTGRVLARSPLATVAKIAAAHHERADASGYPAGIGGSALPLLMAILAAADVYRALLERRPYRDAHSPASAVALLEEEAAAGRLERTAVYAVLRAAGHAQSATKDVPILTAREIEVLRFVAGGLSDKEIAAKLGISPRTVHHHVSSVYRKIAVSSRPGATLYAVEHGLLSTP